MTRRQALAKATITTSDAAAGLLDPSQARAFIRKIKESSNFGSTIRGETRGTTAGEINKLSTAARIIRAATENADDGYRAGAAFGTVPYQAVKVRLPWEVTEDTFHENIEGQTLEDTLVNEMTTQFALDLDDLDLNGDTAASGADAAFLNIDDGILKRIARVGTGAHRIDGSTINAGAINPAHFFEAYYAMPNRYRNRGGLRWLCSPARTVSWWEYLTSRVGDAGDVLLGGREGGAVRGPLGIPFWEVPAMPDNRIVLAEPRNFVRITTWQIRRRRVTGETDAQLAALDKRFYVFFLSRDIIIEEEDAIVDMHTLDPV
jgi:Phage capsid family